MNQKTCGPLYKEPLLRHTGNDPEKVRAFTAGFINGQAEKVYLGAARACMFRPSTERLPMVVQLAEEAASRYGLTIEQLNDEIWLCRQAGALRPLRGMSVNSAPWHAERAILCGVPVPEIDLSFHLRKGFGESCDTFPEKAD